MSLTSTSPLGPKLLTDRVALAYMVSNFSTCVRRKVGAVLLDTEGALVGFGYNLETEDRKCAIQCPRALRSYEEVPADSPYRSGAGACISRHAERRAMDCVKGEDLRGFTMVSTCEPCHECREALDLHEIHIVYAEALT